MIGVEAHHVGNNLLLDSYSGGVHARGYTFTALVYNFNSVHALIGFIY